MDRPLWIGHVIPPERVARSGGTLRNPYMSRAGARNATAVWSAGTPVDGTRASSHVSSDVRSLVPASLLLRMTSTKSSHSRVLHRLRGSYHRAT
jgi:hypothetical protein